MVAYIDMVYPDTKLEEKLWKQGYRVVFGVDEAGRGPLAGPVVAGGVVIENINQVVPLVRDSKKMTEKQRNEAYDQIQQKSTAFGVGIVSASDIDKMGIQKAVLEAMSIALDIVERKLGTKVDYILADGLNIESIPRYKMEKIKKGDMYHYCIAAGSVLAKVARDRIMYEYNNKYPEYGFDTHVGYGTVKHIEAIHKYGITDIHRKSFKPISGLL